ncbi:MAG: porin family protein [Bacteroidetes bacterium]|nr:porin family protein [Bacteroidota bacterium]
MKLSAKIVILVLFYLVSSINIFPQSINSHFSLGGGASIPTQDSLKTGFNIFLNYFNYFGGNFGIKAELSFFTLKIDNETISNLHYNQKMVNKLSGNNDGFTLDVGFIGGKFDIWENFGVYGLFGFGVNVGGTQADLTTTIINSKGETIDEKSNGLSSASAEVNAAVSFGAGVSYKISSRNALVLEIKYVLIEQSSYIPIRIGISF